MRYKVRLPLTLRKPLEMGERDYSNLVDIYYRAYPEERVFIQETETMPDAIYDTLSNIFFNKPEVAKAVNECLKIHEGFPESFSALGQTD